MKLYVQNLLEIYRKYPCMYEADSNWEGFEWMNADDSGRSTYSFVRKAPNRRNKLLFVINMTPMKWEKYRLGVPGKNKWKLLLNSDDEQFGGNGNPMPEKLVPEKVQADYKDYSVEFDLPPYTAAIFVSQG